SPQVRLAAKIARNVKRWMKDGARAGDVLVLVRQRGPLFEAIIRALKDLHVPVAGADRLVLTEHIAVMDLMGLADALPLPEDGLALAGVRKSPLVGFDDAELFELAFERKARCARRCGRKYAATRALPTRRASSSASPNGRARRRSSSMRASSAPKAAASASSRGSVTKPTTRSTNSSISRSTTSGGRRRGCKASSPGCARPKPT